VREEGMKASNAPTVEEAQRKSELILFSENDLINQDLIKRQFNMLV